MKLLIQRVTQAAVRIDDQVVANIDQGLLVLVGFGRNDQASILPKAINKLINLRLFADAKGRFQYSVLDLQKSVLAVPQFTLYGKTDSGRRPDFISAMAPENASQLFDQFSHLLQQESRISSCFGVFGADMQITLTNDGPVTLMLDF